MVLERFRDTNWHRLDFRESFFRVPVYLATSLDIKTAVLFILFMTVAWAVDNSGTALPGISKHFSLNVVESKKRKVFGQVFHEILVSQRFYVKQLWQTTLVVFSSFGGTERVVTVVCAHE